MKITVVTPTYNLQDKIASNVLSVISQTYRNFEHIIVDNLSSDNTVSIIKDLYKKNNCSDKLQIISEKDEGISDAFNKGITNATGEVITILNGDDYYYSNHVFDKIIEALNTKSFLFAHGDIYFTDPTYGSNLRTPLLCDIREAMPFNHPTMFFKKEFYKRFGLFDLSFKYAMDYELICRAWEKIDLFNEGFYFKDFPLVFMSAGGASWKNEIATLKESKTALLNHNFWDKKAKWFYSNRIFRTRLKSLLSLFGLSSAVKLWRNIKWKSNTN